MWEGGKMKPETRLKIRNQWDLNEENHPDSSTEFLLQLTADQCGVEVNVVARAIDDGGGQK